MAEATSRYVIKRKDGVSSIDDLVIDTDGLTIGRLIKNDVVLNHRGVSRTHAGIKQLGQDFWIQNLSSSNGTLLNGELVERTPLADGDLLQIGPFLLKVEYGDSGTLNLNIEKEIEVNPVAGQTGLLKPMTGLLNMGGDESSAKTVFLQNLSAKGAKPIRTPGGTQRLSMTGLLTTTLPGVDEKALKLFWEGKRKRDKGKLSEQTALHPRSSQRIGKIEYNWRSTTDLRKLWRKSYWAWGALVVGVLSLASIFIYKNFYSPDPVSNAHMVSSLTENGKRIALRPNSNSCTECHNVVTGVQNKCIECHNTQTAANPIGFQPRTLIQKHVESNVVACNQCHTEHQGTESAAGLLNHGLCANCHNGQYKIEDGPRKGQFLAIPHGGDTLRLPQPDGTYQWAGWGKDRWKQAFERWDLKDVSKQYSPEQMAALPAVAYTRKDQFHYVHYLGKDQDQEACIVCHKDQTAYDARNDKENIRVLREACLKCHGVPKAENVVGLNTSLANCNTCHKQHPNESKIARSAEETTQQTGQGLRQVSLVLKSNNEAKALNKDNPELLFAGIGGASALRQNKDNPKLELKSDFGAVPWYAWIITIIALPALALVGLVIGTARRKSALNYTVENKILTTNEPLSEKSAAARKVATEQKEKEWTELKQKWLAAIPEDKRQHKIETDKADLEKIRTEGPVYAYPVVNPFTCIGCHACVEACPQDVLQIVNGTSFPVRADQCMDDTSCQIACPTNPKSCIVLNTSKTIPAREVPSRNGQNLQTNVKGIYMVGDISGVPLIKNAINEGKKAIDIIQEDFEGKNGPAPPAADYDVAIVGIGPGGLSAAVIAKQRGLKYIALEQGQTVDMIATVYPSGKYVFFKPDTMADNGGIPLPGPGDTKDNMVTGWFNAMTNTGTVINQNETVKGVKEEGGIFLVSTEKGNLKEPMTYKVRRVVVAIGNRGTPMKLGVPGEDLTIKTQPPPAYPKFCPKCGIERKGKQTFCTKCGEKFTAKEQPMIDDSKVQYRLADPDDYVQKKCIIVGAGNSAIEAACDLAGLMRDGDEIKFVRTNEVTLIVRSDLKGDLKLGNKMNLYDCIDAGKMKVMFRSQIKEIRDGEVTVLDGSKKEIPMGNDYIFALIGGVSPKSFLKSMGITIEGEKPPREEKKPAAKK